jgi:predicted N-formylglutamate amidohydrolase
MTRWLLTCEHGGCRVPSPWKPLFSGAQDVLRSHRGWDRGALCTFRHLAPEIADAAFYATTTRLLVDLNRSPGHRDLFSEFTRDLDEGERRRLLDTLYRPYRDKVLQQVKHWRAAGHVVIHISVHSFTPVMNGVPRNADIGLLYDPGRRLERELCRCWRTILLDTAPHLRTRLNYPYRGTADGLTKHLRREFPQGYAGVELELNEGNVGRRCAKVASRILSSLRTLRAEIDVSRYSSKPAAGY